MKPLVTLVLVWCALARLVAAQSADPPQPRLVVILVIDQFRADYLERFRPDFLPPRQSDGRPGGFLFLEQQAASHSRCFYDHWPTHTAVGHTAIGTGALPYVHGIVNNYWIHRRSGKKIDVAKDPDYTVVGARSDHHGSSPFRLMAPTLGDALKLHTRNRARVFGVAIKDRAAILTTGRMADRAVWFDTDTGHWVTSSYYEPAGHLPEYVAEYNRQKWADKLFGTVWKPTLPQEAFQRSRPFQQEGVYATWKNVGPSFPHRIDGGADKPGPSYYEALTFTPQAMEATFDLARKTIHHEGLGQDETPDLMVISLSTNDKAGHAWGPYSPEVQDITAHTDRKLAAFIDFLESELGLDKVLLVVTSDHGCAPLPEYALSQKLEAGRIDLQQIDDTVNAAIAAEFGPKNYVRGFYDPQMFLDLEGLDDQQALRAKDLAAAALEELPGVQQVFVTEHLRAGRYDSTPLGRRVATGYYPVRFGDLILATQPNWVVSFNDPLGTQHGSGWTYDTQVPLIMLGPGIPAGRYRQTCTPRDLVPTLAELLRIRPPAGADGELLEWLRGAVLR